MTHTPGPWVYHASTPDKFATITANGLQVAIVGGSPLNGVSREERMANGPLIAAAPDLLAALQAIAAMPCDHGPMPDCPRELARAAIAKATS